MGEQKMMKGKIGARALTKAEAKLILPTYEQIETQIEQFRYEKAKTVNRQNAQGEEKNTIQKTNNIGIIGVRGAGKTSLLKTIREDLYRDNQKRKEKDLIFPIIVPENMSESGTLMASILGMFKKFVDECVKKEKKRTHEFCARDNSGLERKYNEVIKQYTFIQKDYRNILIQEYTTENDYVRESAKVFNSDVEFINKFNELVDLLVNGNEQRMIFLFIDDIDLSTYRCTDVVKTMLSYLSNENIVTFISGDLETFEEALALDFLRQEGVISENILGKSMLSGAASGTILENKKKLVYEYLKKIIPPVYRHNIKRWTLEEKGKYRIDNLEGGEEQPGKSLSECLLEALQGWVDPAFFQYVKEEDGKEGKMEILPYTYHLFDDTSRGLNNVYILLNEIIDKRKMEKNGSDNTFIREKKQLLDTIVSSKHLYSQYREQIRNNMFVAGEESSEVFFDNAYSIIYNQENSLFKHSQNSLETHPVERFSLFVFVDFAARLLYGKDYLNKVKEDRSYSVLKENAVKDLFFYPSIAEKVKKAELDKTKWKNMDEKSNTMTLLDLTTNFLVKGDFVFNLVFYHSLPLEEIWSRFYSKDKDKENGNSGTNLQSALYINDTELEQKVFFAFEKSISSITKCSSREMPMLEDNYRIFGNEFNYIQNKISNIPIQNLSINLFGGECKRAAANFSETYWFNEDILPRWIMERILSNTIAEWITPEWEKQNENGYIEKIIDDIRRKISAENTIKDFNQRVEIIKIVDRQNLWRELAAEKVINYLNGKVVDGLKQMVGNFSPNDNLLPGKLNINYAKDNLEEFNKSYDGVSTTKFSSAKTEIWNTLYHEANTSDNYGKAIIEIIMETGISYKAFLKVLNEAYKLANNYAIWYGRVEAQELWNGLLKSYIQMDESQKNALLEFRFYLHYYFRYKMAVSDVEKARRQAERLKKITEGLSAAHQNANQKVLNQFIEALNKNLEIKIDSDSYNKLFD